MKGFKNRLMVVTILIIIGSIAPHLGAKENTESENEYLTPFIYGQCSIMDLQMDLEEVSPDMVVYWIEFAKARRQSLKGWRELCDKVEVESEAAYMALGDKVVERQTM